MGEGYGWRHVLSRCPTTPPATGQRFKLHLPTSISNPAYTPLSGISQASLASFLAGTVCAGGGSPCSSAATRSCAKQVQTASLELTKPTARQLRHRQQTAATFHSNLGFYAEFLVTEAKTISHRSGCAGSAARGQARWQWQAALAGLLAEPALAAGTAWGAARWNTHPPARKAAPCVDFALMQGEKGNVSLTPSTLCSSRDDAKWRVVVSQ